MRRLNLGAIFLVVLNLCWVTSYAADAPSLEEGKQYQRLGDDVNNNSLVQEHAKEGGQKIQVLEFFSYGCSWCYKLDPYLQNWERELPAYVSFRRVPVEFQPAWRTLTRAYYAAEKLDALDAVHMPLFEAIHSGKMDNTSEETLRQFFISKGIKVADFNREFDSFEVANKQKWANAVSRAYKINAVPAVVVQGPAGIFMTTISMSGSEENLLETLNYLIKIEHDAMPKKSLPNTKKTTR